MKRCRLCGKSQTRLSTDGHGHTVEVSTPCVCVQRKAAGLCRTCPAPLPSKLSTYCRSCAAARKRECCRLHAARKRGNPNPPPATWRKDIIEERRLAGVCQLCTKPVDGKPKMALYCQRHRTLMRSAAQRRHRAKTSDASRKAYQERNREKLRERARQYYQKSKRVREQRNAYKREWRQKNREKVRLQKRRDALRGNAAERMRRYHERVKRGEVQPGEKAPRGPNGERLCLRCPTPLTGRAKLCQACRCGEMERAA